MDYGRDLATAHCPKGHCQLNLGQQKRARCRMRDHAASKKPRYPIRRARGLVASNEIVAGRAANRTSMISASGTSQTPEVRKRRRAPARRGAPRHRIAQREPQIEPDRMLDDHRRKAVAAIRDFGHRASSPVSVHAGGGVSSRSAVEGCGVLRWRSGRSAAGQEELAKW